MSRDAAADLPRQEYDGPQLDEAALSSDPLAQIRLWLDEAIERGVPEANALCLTTVAARGLPSSRMVLLKAVDDRGVTIYTNLGSRKAMEATETGVGAAVLHWRRLRRQISMAGRLETVDAATADAYFATRPRRSQIAAWSSRQSVPIASRVQLEDAYAQQQARFAAGEVPRPPFWGGLRLVPEWVELWQGRRDRLHDRIRYEGRSPEGAWMRTRYQP